ncbi:GTP cyclohydrolase I FolE [Kitasatospora xanthocidica]|uniref:GTP cyclohydrolase 1 n=1 Tax=Kitasatospora xanthocidica TaxID=83382 RepID=A0A373A1P8_9ACTN|nr:GTP cyclohydrolase I FolE [Kitasatospora xanthocidica]RGD62053.1 GTP cyclohydrolase I FolE [Kitasatospora xanthocidica]
MTTPANTADLARAVEHAAGLLAALGIPCDTESTAATPRRMAKALAELTAGVRLDPARHLAVTFPPEGERAGLIAAVDVPFTALCEHHVLPFTGRAAVAYLPTPGARIVGLSKLARLVQEFAARPQVQERLGQQVVDALGAHLDIQGAGCLIRSQHACMTARGARAHGAAMVTTHLTGALHADLARRAEVLALMPPPA